MRVTKNLKGGREHLLIEVGRAEVVDEKGGDTFTNNLIGGRHFLHPIEEQDRFPLTVRVCHDRYTEGRAAVLGPDGRDLVVYAQSLPCEVEREAVIAARGVDPLAVGQQIALQSGITVAVLA